MVLTAVQLKELLKPDDTRTNEEIDNFVDTIFSQGEPVEPDATFLVKYDDAWLDVNSRQASIGILSNIDSKLFAYVSIRIVTEFTHANPNNVLDFITTSLDRQNNNVELITNDIWGVTAQNYFLTYAQGEFHKVVATNFGLKTVLQAGRKLEDLTAGEAVIKIYLIDA